MIVLKYTRNLQEDLESQLDLVAPFHLFAPEDLQGLEPRWDLLLPKGMQREVLIQEKYKHGSIQRWLLIWSFTFYPQTFKGTRSTKRFTREMSLTWPKEWTHFPIPSSVTMPVALRAEPSGRRHLIATPFQPKIVIDPFHFNSLIISIFRRTKYLSP